MAIISTHGLTKTFRVRTPGTGWLSPERVERVAVQDLTIAIEPGEAVGYIGANGAGKSTTIKMLIGVLRPTSGEVVTCGLDPMRDRVALARQIGVVFGQRSQLWWDLPLRDSFDILAAIHGIGGVDRDRRLDRLVETLELSDFMGSPVRQLSLGQRMRGEIAAALVHSPRLLILDEPTIGLDVVSKARLREFLRLERAESGTTLLLTTHDMGDIERLCDRVLVVDQGRLAYDGSLPGLVDTVGAGRVLTVDLAEAVPDLPVIEGTSVLAVEGGGFRYQFAISPEVTTAAAVLTALSAYAEVVDLTVEDPDIEDVVSRIYRSSAGK